MIDKARNLLFIHIPRTGGTSIENNLKATKGEYNLQGIYMFGKNKKALQHLDCKEIISKIGIEEFNNYYKISVVRHPYMRMISEFYWRPKAQQKSCPNLKCGYNFYKFLRHVKSIVENKDYNITVFHDHFKPQYEYITLDDKIIVDKLINFNNLAKEYDFIREKYNISESLLKIQSSDYLTGKKCLLTESCKNMIYDIYKKDFEMFNFSR